VELLGSGKGSLAAALLAHCQAHTLEMLTSRTVADVVVELCQGDCSGGLWDACEADVRALHAAVAAAAAESTSGAAEGAETDVGPAPAPAEPVLEHYFASRAILKMISGTKGDAGSAAARDAFCSALWEGAVQGRCKALIASHAAKIVAALATCGNPDVVAAARKELKGCVKGVDAWCSGGWKAKK